MGEYDGGNTTGFASPAGDYLEGPIDLGEILELRRPSRYPVRVAGRALESRAIRPGDVLVVDSAVQPVAGQVAIVMLEGTTLVGQLAYRTGTWWLCSGLPEIAPRRIEGDDAEIWGVAVALVRTRV